MRGAIWLLVLVLGLGLAACGEQRGDPPPGGGTLDLSAADDLGVAEPADLAEATGPLGCKGYVACLAACGSSAACASACTLRLEKEAEPIYEEGVGCGQAFCLDDTTGQPARCVVSGGSLADPPDGGSGVCTRCLTNALAAFFGGTCLPATHPDCNPSGCTYTIAQCQASTP